MPIVASLLLCSLVGPAVGGAAVAAQDDTGAGSEGLASLTQEFEADRVDFEIVVYENGSATWVFRYKQDLDSEEERQDFEAYAEEFETNETELYTTFQAGAERLTTNGSEVTGREMSAETFQREARTEGLDPAQATRGVVEMSFRWDGFARVDDDGRVVMGDVFEGGLYITADQQLVVRTGPTLGFVDVQPDDGEFNEGSMARSTTVTWEGAPDGREFNPGRPRVVFADADSAPTETTDGAPAEGTPGWLFPLGVAVLALVLGVGAAVAYRSGAFPPSGEGGATVDSGDPGGGADAASGGAGAGAAAVSEEELISDEERVVNLLEDNEGRMKQVNIVEETGWSKSKVSMLLSDMEEEGTISKLRVGRENIVSLAGHEPDAAGSPFEEDGG